jgi:succinate dehydrogenase / fumarate reductase cytochrome b subunit
VRTNNNTRPVFLNLFKIHLPVTAVLSVAHRLTGIVLFLMIPVLIYLLDLSLTGPAGFARVRALLQEPLWHSLLILLTWFIAHHFFAGIRYLLIDIDIGIRPPASRLGAWVVLAAGIVTVIIASLGVL